MEGILSKLFFFPSKKGSTLFSSSLRKKKDLQEKKVNHLNVSVRL